MEPSSDAIDAPASRFPRPDDVYQLRVSLIDIEPLIWRRLLVQQDVTLPRLHHILQTAMGWTDSHLHQFLVGDVRLAEPDDEFAPGPIDYRGITLNQILRRKGSTCVYEYDFGDGWKHVIELEDELPAASVTGVVPQCLAGERRCPPEDAGGTSGYERLLEALRDPGDEEHEEFRVWAGPHFDPETFDVEVVNKALARFAPRPRTPKAATRPPRR